MPWVPAFGVKAKLTGPETQVTLGTRRSTDYQRGWLLGADIHIFQIIGIHQKLTDIGLTFSPCPCAVLANLWKSCGGQQRDAIISHCPPGITAILPLQQGREGCSRQSYSCGQAERWLHHLLLPACGSLPAWMRLPEVVTSCIWVAGGSGKWHATSGWQVMYRIWAPDRWPKKRYRPWKKLHRSTHTWYSIQPQRILACHKF